jgi:hypothetical protein
MHLNKIQCFRAVWIEQDFKMWNIFHGPLKDEEILYLNIEYFKDTIQMYNF